MSLVAGADHREHRQPARAGDTQQGEKATERRKDGEAEQIKKPSIQRPARKIDEGRRKESRTENRGRKG